MVLGNIKCKIRWNQDVLENHKNTSTEEKTDILSRGRSEETPTEAKGISMIQVEHNQEYKEKGQGIGGARK